MKNKLFLSVIILFISGVLFSQNRSVKKYPQKKPKGFVYIPSGTISMDTGEDIFTMCIRGNQRTIVGFWMKETEVTNQEYQIYLNDIKITSGEKAYKNVYPDTALIHRELWISRYLDYFTHPDFKNYPVIGITARQAELYCVWLSKKLQNKYPEQHYDNFRLPLKEEWEYAARGGKSRGMDYPWGGPYCRNNKGCMLANYKFNDTASKLNDNFNFRSPWIYGPELNPLLDRFFINSDTLRKRKYPMYPGSTPAPVYAFYPNDRGLYNIAGNVEELTRGSADSINGADSLHYTAYGGSYAKPAANMNLNTMIPDITGPDIARVDAGFRPVMTYFYIKKSK